MQGVSGDEGGEQQPLEVVMDADAEQQPEQEQSAAGAEEQQQQQQEGGEGEQTTVRSSLTLRNSKVCGGTQMTCLAVFGSGSSVNAEGCTIRGSNFGAHAAKGSKMELEGCDVMSGVAGAVVTGERGCFVIHEWRISVSCVLSVVVRREDSCVNESFASVQCVTDHSFIQLSLSFVRTGGAAILAKKCNIEGGHLALSVERAGTAHLTQCKLNSMKCPTVAPYIPSAPKPGVCIWQACVF